MRKIIIFGLFLIGFSSVYGQTRIDSLTQKLEELSTRSSGLNNKVDFSVVGVSIQEFLRGLAEGNDLNISIDPTLDLKVYNNFTNERALNVIVLLCKEYDLDVDIIGTIMSIKRYVPPAKIIAPKKRREIIVEYQKQNDLLTLDLKNDSLSKVVHKITELSGKNVVISPQIEQSKLSNVFIKNIPFSTALEKLAYSTGLKLTTTDDGFFLLEPLVKKLEEEEGKGKRGKYSSRKRKRGDNEELEVEFFQDSLGKDRLKIHAVNIPVDELINEVSEKVGENYFLYSEPKGKTTCTIQDVNYEDFLSFILRGSDYTYKLENKIYLIGERKIEGLRTTRVLTLKYRTYSEVAEHIPAELKKGVEISEFSELNSIIMSGSTPQIMEIEHFLKEIDKVVPVIMIEVIFVDIDRNRSLSTGLSMGLADSTVSSSGDVMNPETGGLDVILGASTINNLTGPLNLGNVSPNFYMSLKAAEQQQYANVKSVPKLATLNAHEATLKSGETRYYRNEKSTTTGGINPATIVTVEQVPVQADLSITIKPIVSGDEQITLDITVEVSDFVGDAPDNAPPRSRTKTFTSMIRVKNDDMIVLGGIERTEKTESSKGLPLLGRLPILKWFFSSRTKTKKKMISIVFVRPTVIY